MRRHSRVLPRVFTLLMLPSALAVLFAGVCLASGCAPKTIQSTGEVATEERQIGDVNAVKLTCPGVVTLVPNSKPGVTIRADKAAMRYLKTDESAGRLTISLEGGGRSLGAEPNVTIEIEVRSSAFSGITNTGSGSVRASALDTSHLQVLGAGSGMVEIARAHVVQITCEVAGSGRVSIGGGKAGAQDVRITGSGSYAAPNLESGVVTVTMRGSGEAEVWAVEGLDVTGSGSGTVSYWGDPRLTEEASESEKVESLGAK